MRAEPDFQAIVSGTKRAVLGAIRHHLSPQLHEWIDDVAQETYLRLFRHLDRQQGEHTPESLQSLAYVIARNESFRMNGKMGRENVGSDQLDSLADDRSQRERDTKETLSAALSLLDEELAPVVAMTAGGYSTAEIAERMQIPAGTVKSRLYRARKKLRENVSGWFGSDRRSR
ncbi:RNA polymerase sigma factor [Leptonema illini]|uniref:RNA polymerase, sigma-24 subunit, ECF subfamily n=1 Tax=Leptonema illini DSM 21528 TaxID=929563 RepID=H2CCH3_9LEPT|nr:sigma-70 family RNA polymerase sigma factor [Leptonema illini]EHQ07433.1 RNA polymerase, sigma-24 subunit, ECF subfamily [Leptonema illini DSM 21528]